MSDKAKQRYDMNPTIHSILDNLAEKSVPVGNADLWPVIQKRLEKRLPGGRQKNLFPKRVSFIPAAAVVLALVFIGIYLSSHVTPVSAQQILERATAIQELNQSKQGIGHYRTESIYYPNAVDGDLTSVRSINDSFYDYEKGNIRWVISDPITGKVRDAYSYDGTYTLSADQMWLANPSGDLLPVIRTDEPNDYLASIVRDGGKVGPKQLFLMNLDQPNVEMVGVETMPDGSKAYVLRSKGIRKSDAAGQVNKEPENIYGLMFFDTQTYQLLESREMMKKGDQEILLASNVYLIDELLPAGSQVPWDMSDLKGIIIVDDLGNESSDSSGK